MYWPIGTPRVYATSSSRAPGSNLFVSNDGLPKRAGDHDTLASSADSDSGSVTAHDEVDALPPQTPLTPATPSIQSIEYADNALGISVPDTTTRSTVQVPLKDPILALRVSRTGNLFAVITGTSITLWQTKVRHNRPPLPLSLPLPSLDLSG